MAQAYCVVGPTSSGKSHLALTLAARVDGMIVNADSLQVYKDLPLLTARPSPAEEEATPHFLYGSLPHHQGYSVAQWLEDVAPLTTRFDQEKRPLIFVGGTGLYIKALLEGLVYVPPIAPQVRAQVRRAHAQGGYEGLLTMWHGVGVGVLGEPPLDPQRTIRALEVYLSSGRPLKAWQEAPSRPLIENPRIFHVFPSKEVVVARAQARLAWAMGDSLHEIETLFEQDPDLSNAPLMQALGARELLAFCQGTLSWEAALTKAQIRTRQYIKRQNTWFRHQLKNATLLTQDTPEAAEKTLLACL